MQYRQAAEALHRAHPVSSAGQQLSDLLDQVMPAAFSPAEADFSGITGDRSLFISDVRHKAFVSVDEQGTEAAAATMVAVPVSGVGETVEMTIDRPFVFLIRDVETGALLFVGRVLDPA